MYFAFESFRLRIFQKRSDPDPQHWSVHVLTFMFVYRNWWIITLVALKRARELWQERRREDVRGRAQAFLQDTKLVKFVKLVPYVL